MSVSASPYCNQHIPAGLTVEERAPSPTPKVSLRITVLQQWNLSAGVTARAWAFSISKSVFSTVNPRYRCVIFITFTCYKWLPLIEMTSAYDLVYKWFDFLKEKAHNIVGYVIMPNHMHAVIAFWRSRKDMNKVFGHGKRFLAYGIVDSWDHRVNPIL